MVWAKTIPTNSVFENITSLGLGDWFLSKWFIDGWFLGIWNTGSIESTTYVKYAIGSDLFSKVTSAADVWDILSVGSTTYIKREIGSGLFSKIATATTTWS